MIRKNYGYVFVMMLCLLQCMFLGDRFWGDVEPGWFELVAAVPTQRNGTGHQGKFVGDGKRGTFFFLLLLLLFMSLIPSMEAFMEDQQNSFIHWAYTGNTTT